MAFTKEEKLKLIKLLNQEYPNSNISTKNTKITEENDSIRIKYGDNEIDLPKPTQETYDSIWTYLAGAGTVLATLFIASKINK